MSDEYFAAKKTDEIGPELVSRIEDFYEYLKASGRLALYKRSFDYYYQAVRSGGKVYNSGEEGEFTNVDLADYRNILQHLKVMTTSQRPAYDPKATNSDHKSQGQAVLASGLLDYYLAEKRFERLLNMACDYTLKYGEGYIELDWNATAGETYINEADGTPKNEGDLEGRVYTPADVIVDFTRPEAANHDWRITRHFENKWNLAAKYAPKPKGRGKDKNEEFRSRILSCDLGEKDRETIFGFPQLYDTDMIPVYTFHHKRCDALPNGRMVRFVSADAILTDGDLPFKNITLYRMAADEQDGSCFGYTVAFDLLPLQQAINALLSTIATNASSFGVQNIMAPKGHGLSVSQIVEGLNLLEYDSTQGKPEPLNLLSIPAELFKFIDQLRNMMEIIAGLNSVARGDPEASLKSGSALALVQSMAVQFNSGLQAAFAQIAEDMGTGMIEILQNFASTKRVSAIVGKAKRPLVKEWTGADLDKISRVKVDMGNPMSRTTAGRVNMAEALMSKNMIENPDQYIQVLTTGRLDPVIEGKQAALLNIKGENELLSDGKMPIAAALDMHAMHIQEHSAVIASPEARADPGVVKAVMDHIQRHIDLLRDTDPITLQILGQQPLPPLQNPAAPTGGPPPPGGPSPGGPTPEAVGAGTAPGGPPIESIIKPPELGKPNAPVRLPSQPTNPLTGSKFNPVDGGIQ